METGRKMEGTGIPCAVFAAAACFHCVLSTFLDLKCGKEKDLEEETRKMEAFIPSFQDDLWRAKKWS